MTVSRVDKKHPDFLRERFFLKHVFYDFFLTVILFPPTIPVYNVERDIAVFDA